MGITAKRGEGGDFVQAPEGTHLARCYGLIDLGTQHGEYQGKPTVRRQVLVQWELPNEMVESFEGGRKPAMVSKFYTLVLSEKSNLQKDLESWRGRAFTDEEAAAFDITKLMSKACMLSIVHEKERAKVKAVMAVPKGTEVPPQFNESFIFSFETYDHAAFMKIPDGIRKIIEQSDEWKEINSGRSVQRLDRAVDDFADDIPF